MATTNDLLPVFDHTHGIATTTYVVVATVLGGLFASWLAADFGLRTPAFVVAAVVLGYALYGQPTQRSVVAGSLYSLAALIVLTPVALNLPYVTNGGMPSLADPWAMVLTVADLQIFVAFLVLAAIPSAVAYGLTNGAAIRARVNEFRNES